MASSTQKRRPRAFKISTLNLDLYNPRFTRDASTQLDALILLQQIEGKKIYNLARDIVARGELNPTELPMVITEDGKKVVVEGNRRLAALKLLHTPSLAVSKSEERKFARLAKNADLPTTIDAVEFANRSEPAHWIFLRHTGSNDGVGVSDWVSQSTNRFQSGYIGKVEIHSALCRYLRESFPDDGELIKEIDVVTATQFTTLKRLITPKNAREKLGLTIENGMLHAAYPVAALLPFARQLFGDLSTKLGPGDSWTRRWGTASDREAYFDKHAGLLPGATHEEQPEPTSTSVDINSSRGTGQQDSQEEKTNEEPGLYDKSDSTEDSNVDLSSSPQKPELHPVEPAKAHKYLFEGVNFKAFGNRVHALSKALSGIEIAKHPELCGVMSRVLVELCTVHYEKAIKKYSENTDLWKRITNVLRVIEPEIGKPRAAVDAELLRVFENVDRGNQGLAVRSMNEYVHNTPGISSVSEVQFFSTLFKPYLLAMSTHLCESS